MSRRSGKTQRERRNKVSSAWKQQIKIDQNYVCPECGKTGNDNSMNIHHCLPKCKGGKNTPENCCAVHITCHRRIHEEHGLHFYDPRQQLNKYDESL